MGSALPKPVLSKLVEREGNAYVNIGSCAVNGFRSSMEDSHMLAVYDDMTYCGIFDGHSNDRCSAFLAEQIPPRLRALTKPLTSDAIEKMCIDVDTAFLTKNDDGGSTATMCMIDSDLKVTVANVGDSRILIIRNGALIFETSDHKPYDTDERERIVRCGGSVIGNRVDGDLAVSRAFGDGVFKVRGTRTYKNQKVIAIPDVSEVACKQGDIIVVACDGVFEGSFANVEVCRYISDQLDKCWDDTAVLACRVCDEAIRRGSKDNISCMIVRLIPGVEMVGRFGAHSFVPGPPFPKNHESCRAAYAAMAARARMTSAEALQLRYQLLQAREKKILPAKPPIMRIAFEMSDDVDIDCEKGFFGRGPAPGNEKAFFEALAQGNN